MSSYKTLGALLIGSLVWIASPVWAAKGLSQSFADIGYLHAETDFADLDGVLVNGAFGVHDYLSLRAKFFRAKTDDFKLANDTPDFTEFQLGFRPHYGFSKKGDLFADLLYTNAKINGNNFDRSEKGWIYAGGIRYKLFKKAELLVAGEYRSGPTDEFFVVAGPVIKLTKRFALNIKTSQARDDQDYFVGLRINF